MARRVIEIREVSKTYSPHRAPVRALDEVSFTVDEAQFVTLVGPSGCGKSTLLLILAGLVPSSTGEAWVDGEQIHGPVSDDEVAAARAEWP